MGMPCIVNSIVKLTPEQGYPTHLGVGQPYEASKSGYRILPIDVPIPLVDHHWDAHADIIITKLTWEHGQTHLTFTVHRLYPQPFPVKDPGAAPSKE